MKEIQINSKLVVREDGRLFNIKTSEEFIPCIANNGYYQVVYWGKRKSLHRIIAELFIPNPEHKPCVRKISEIIEKELRKNLNSFNNKI